MHLLNKLTGHRLNHNVCLQAPSDGSQVLTKEYIDYNYSAGNSGSFTNAREVQKRFDMDPGTYIILPCAFKPGEEGEFLLRIFTEKSSKKPVQRYIHVCPELCVLNCVHVL